MLPTGIVKRLLFPLFLVFIVTTGVWGHFFPLRSDPKVGSGINESPASLRIWFDGPLEFAFSGMKLLDAEGRRVDRGEGKVVSNDPTLLSLPLPELGAGKYQVR
ncbi:MAG: copper resistance protein CopC [Nitrospiria bacterium]